MLFFVARSVEAEVQLPCGLSRSPKKALMSAKVPRIV